MQLWERASSRAARRPPVQWEARQVPTTMARRWRLAPRSWAHPRRRRPAALPMKGRQSAAARLVLQEARPMTEQRARPAQAPGASAGPMPERASSMRVRARPEAEAEVKTAQAAEPKGEPAHPMKARACQEGTPVWARSSSVTVRLEVVATPTWEAGPRVLRPAVRAREESPRSARAQPPERLRAHPTRGRRRPEIPTSPGPAWPARQRADPSLAMTGAERPRSGRQGAPAWRKRAGPRSRRRRRSGWSARPGGLVAPISCASCAGVSSGRGRRPGWPPPPGSSPRIRLASGRGPPFRR
jgi:hypothetical protein